MGSNETSIVILTHSHGPVNAQMQRYKNKVIEEEVYSLGPALHCSVSSDLPPSSIPQLGEEEGAE